MSDEIELELRVDDEFATSVSGPSDQVFREMCRYWAQYSADGKCSVYQVTRTQVHIEDLLGIREAVKRADADLENAIYDVDADQSSPAHKE